MSNIVNLNSRRTLRERFNQAVKLINEFEYMTYHEALTVEREKMRNALQSEMMKIIGITDEPARELTELTIANGLSGIFLFMMEGELPPSKQDIEHAKVSGNNYLMSALTNEAELLGLDLNQL